MPTHTRASGALLVVAVLCASAARSEPTPVSAEEFAGLLVGNTLVETAGYSVAWVVHAKQDGTAIFKNNGGMVDAGRWTIEDDKFCWQWEKARRGERYCLRDFARDGNAVSYYDETGQDKQLQLIKQGVFDPF